MYGGGGSSGRLGGLRKALELNSSIAGAQRDGGPVKDTLTSRDDDRCPPPTTPRTSRGCCSLRRLAMLPYDGEEQAVAAPSTSDWSWDPRFGLYFNFKTKQWAKPLPNGEWEYAGGVEHDQADQAENGDSRDEDGLNGDADPFAVPEEQVWPGNGTDDEDEASKPDPFARAPLLRLVVSKRPDPSVLPPAQTVASLDPSEPVSIGRDKSFERRIRLRELAVSKVQATLFWALDPETEDGGYWAIVDNGSTHGTFISSDRSGREIRLSEPKVASVPHRLHHLECVAISLFYPVLRGTDGALAAAPSAPVRPPSLSTSTQPLPARLARSPPTLPTSSRSSPHRPTGFSVHRQRRTTTRPRRKNRRSRNGGNRWPG